MRVQDVHVFESGYIARVDGVLFQIWRDRVPVDGARAAKQLAEEIARQGIKPFGIYIETFPKVKPPEGEARKILIDLGMHSKGCQALSFVSAGGGFVSAANRAIMSSMANLVRVDYPVDVSKGPEAGLSWLAEKLALDAAALQSARARMLRAWDVSLATMPSASVAADSAPAAAAGAAPAPSPDEGAVANAPVVIDQDESGLDSERSTTGKWSPPKRVLPTSLKEAFAPRKRQEDG